MEFKTALTAVVVGRSMSDVGSRFPDLIIKLKQARASVWLPLEPWKANE